MSERRLDFIGRVKLWLDKRRLDSQYVLKFCLDLVLSGVFESAYTLAMFWSDIGKESDRLERRHEPLLPLLQ